MDPSPVHPIAGNVVTKQTDILEGRHFIDSPLPGWTFPPRPTPTLPPPPPPSFHSVHSGMAYSLLAVLDLSGFESSKSGLLHTLSGCENGGEQVFPGLP